MPITKEERVDMTMFTIADVISKTDVNEWKNQKEKTLVEFNLPIMVRNVLKDVSHFFNKNQAEVEALILTEFILRGAHAAISDAVHLGKIERFEEIIEETKQKCEDCKDRDACLAGVYVDKCH